MARRSRRGYCGDLARPIKKPVIGLLASGEQIEETAKALVAEKWRRMTLLFSAHNVPYGDWIKLCFALAEHHVPGFHVAKAPSGRQTKWTDVVRAELVLAVEDTGLSIADATKLLATRAPWKSLVGATNGARRLADEYGRAHHPTVALLRHVRACEKEFGPLRNNCADTDNAGDKPQ